MHDMKVALASVQEQAANVKQRNCVCPIFHNFFPHRAEAEATFSGAINGAALKK